VRFEVPPLHAVASTMLIDSAYADVPLRRIDADGDVLVRAVDGLPVAEERLGRAWPVLTATLDDDVGAGSRR
jgi:hypothetical protein